MPRRRIWCETVAAAELAAPATADLLARFGVQPILAVWPDTMHEARIASRSFADRRLAPALWPMLPDAEGRWIGAANASRFVAFVERVVAELGPREIVLDLEPPIAALRASIASTSLAAHVLPMAADAASFEEARSRIAALASRLHACGASISAAIAAPVLFDDAGSEGWELRLGTPVSGVGWDHVSPMLYTSMVEGWSRGLLDRDAARAFLAWGCRRTLARFGTAAGASLGAVGVGAFGDEPTYRAPAELADDVAIARAAGLDDLALFDLGGVLRRPPAEAWLEAFTAPSAPAVREPTSLRVRAMALGAGVAGRLFERAVRGRPVSARGRRVSIAVASRR